MINIILYISTVIIWGTTWIAIAAQIGETPVLVSIFYRFLLAAVIMISVLFLLKKLQKPHKWSYIIVQAMCLFCFNFVGLYMASASITSGLVSVIFSLASIFNSVNSWIFFKERISPKTFLCGIIGVIGLTLIFWDALFIEMDTTTLKGIGWAVLGTLFFSFGNMASRKNSELGISLMTSNSWGMAIGAFVLILMISFSGQSYVISSDTQYWVALGYLSIVGTVLAFTAYLVLVSRIGSGRAGYATVLFPIVALIISTFFEGYVWTTTALVGVFVTIIGNVLMFMPSKIKKS